jgi:hypothetical protein
MSPPMPQPQTYANHVYRPLLSIAAGFFAGVALLVFLARMRDMPGALALGLLCLTMSVLLLVAMSRTYILRLQDRIIRLEMRLRLARLGREADLDRLTRPQFIALRFASDAELPALLDRALTERLTSRQIKEAVRDWQGDYHRT